MGKLTNFQNLGMTVMKITTELLNNQDLCKLLYYTNEDPLNQPDITNTKESLFNKNIHIVPAIPIEDYDGSYLNVVVDTISTMGSKGSAFNTVSIRFDILCPIDLWAIHSTQLRPFAIMSEIDKFMRLSKKTGIGEVENVSATFVAPTETLAGYSLFYYGTEFK